MAITGVLSEFSLPEIFQFVEKGHKTGLLTVRTLPGIPSQPGVSHYVWFHLGRVVAAADCLDGQGLLQLIAHRNWISHGIISKLSLVCSAKSPLGVCLKSQGILQAEQLKLLFYGQVIRQVCALFQLSDGLFNFESQTCLPLIEMTGLSMPATNVTITGLRALRNWAALTDKLPTPDSALVSLAPGQPTLHLNAQEWQIWEFVNGKMTLREIASQLGQPLETVQQIAFRLIVVNLAEEVPVVGQPVGESAKATTELVPRSTEVNKETNGVSQSFLQNLVSFLRAKV